MLTLDVSHVSQDFAVNVQMVVSLSINTLGTPFAPSLSPRKSSLGCFVGVDNNAILV